MFSSFSEISPCFFIITFILMPFDDYIKAYNRIYWTDLLAFTLLDSRATCTLICCCIKKP